MKQRITRHPYFHYSICLLLVALVYGRASAQSFPEPNREQLLNGLKVLYAEQPGNADVLLKLRIQSGAVFDLAGKSGTMATREYVTEQLGGKLEVSTSYDGIDITISGRASDFERLVGLLRGAVVTTQLTTENISRVRETRLKQLSERSGSASDMADRAIAARLFGAFPYGQPAGGTPETVSKIDRADLLLARERFLNADNAILVVIGGVAKLRVMRTLRQLVGPWQKSDRMVPATFRPPAAPETRIMLLNQANGTTAEIRLAVRGLARSDRDAAAAALLAQIVRSRWQAAQPDLLSVFVRDDAHLLPGAFVLGGAGPNASAAKAVVVAQQVLRMLAQSGPSAAELEGARAIVLADLNRRASQSESIADLWLDIELFKLAAAPAQASSIQSLTVGDIQRVASRLFKDASIATVVIGDFEQLKATFDGTVELRSEKPNTGSAVDPVMPTKKP
jgi:zinc protease